MKNFYASTTTPTWLPSNSTDDNEYNRFYFKILHADSVKDLPNWYELHQAKNIHINRDQFNNLVKFAEQRHSEITA